MSISNYDITKTETAKLFLCYDQQTMIDRYALAHDEDYLYLPMLGRMHRICRATGLVEWSEDGFETAQEADFNAAMTIYDVLCYAKAHARLSGNFVRVNSLPGLVTASRVGESLSDGAAAFFDKNPAALRHACERLGSVKEGKGDVAFRMALFPFLPVRLQFWHADEDFPADLQLLWDENTLDFMHYETVWYAAGYIRQRLRRLADANTSL